MDALCVCGCMWKLEGSLADQPFAMFEAGLLFLCCVCLNSWPGHTGVSDAAVLLEFKSRPHDCMPGLLAARPHPRFLGLSLLSVLTHCSALFFFLESLSSSRCLVYFQMTETFLWEEDAKWHSEPFLSPLCVK